MIPGSLLPVMLSRSTSVTTTTTTIPPPLTYATWNPGDKASNLWLSLGNLVASSGGGWNSVRATQSKLSGKWYWEVTLQNASYNGMLGVCDSSFPIASNSCVGQASGNVSIGLGLAYDNVFNGNSNVPMTVSPLAVGVVIMLALDMDNKAMYFGKMGSWLNSGNPLSGAAKTGGISIANAGQAVYPALTSQNGFSSLANFGATPFIFGLPSGYSGVGI